jgi:hypothetical protein
MAPVERTFGPFSVPQKRTFGLILLGLTKHPGPSEKSEASEGVKK